MSAAERAALLGGATGREEEEGTDALAFLAEERLKAATSLTPSASMLLPGLWPLTAGAARSQKPPEWRSEGHR